MFDPRLLVGYDSSDDACVYSVSDDVAVIETVDFFTPIVDDPYLFGQIAAANALSDVYAMGGVPKPAASSPAGTPFRTTSRNMVCASPASSTRSTSSRTSARSRATCSC